MASSIVSSTLSMTLEGIAWGEQRNLHSALTATNQYNDPGISMPLFAGTMWALLYGCSRNERSRPMVAVSALFLVNSSLVCAVQGFQYCT